MLTAKISGTLIHLENLYSTVMKIWIILIVFRCFQQKAVLKIRYKTCTQENIHGYFHAVELLVVDSGSSLELLMFMYTDI